jgi:hypothetical protein
MIKEYNRYVEEKPSRSLVLGVVGMLIVLCAAFSFFSWSHFFDTWRGFLFSVSVMIIGGAAALWGFSSKPGPHKLIIAETMKLEEVKKK